MGRSKGKSGSNLEHPKKKPFSILNPRSGKDWVEYDQYQDASSREASRYHIIHTDFKGEPRDNVDPNNWT